MIENKSKPLILVVDDRDFERDMLKQLMSDEFEIIEATSGKECLEKVNEFQNKIDVVILDLMMPVMNGFEVLENRKESDVFADIPVIVLTASEENDDQIRAFELGVNDYILKPIVKGIARARIRNVIASHKKLQMLKLDSAEYKLRSQIDQMTGLFNKMTIEKSIDKSLKNSSGRYNALLVLDIDNFKNLNDRGGHQKGDIILKFVANAMVKCFSHNDMLGRIGGDEFIIYMENISTKDTARRKAESLLKEIRTVNPIGVTSNLRVSIGLAITDGNIKNYGELFKKADQALFYSKSNGKDRVTEYGREEQLVNMDRRKVVVIVSENRSTCNLIEEALDEKIRLVFVEHVRGLGRAILKGPEMIGLIYLDISFCMQELKEVWQEFKESYANSSIPVIAICEEGNLEQYKEALSHTFISDIIITPLVTEQLERRTKMYLKER